MGASSGDDRTVVDIVGIMAGIIFGEQTTTLLLALRTGPCRGDVGEDGGL